ncbi:hypothetical protein AZE42_08272, partial [Rhizopogon vesiculosus]
APPVDQPAPAAGSATRNQHQPGYLPRQALAAAPRRPVVDIHTIDPAQQTSTIRSRIRQPEVPAARDPTPPVPPSLLTTRGAEAYAPPPPSRPAIHHTEAPSPAPPTVPQPCQLTTRPAETPGQASSRAVPFPAHDLQF